MSKKNVSPVKHCDIAFISCNINFAAFLPSFRDVYGFVLSFYVIYLLLINYKSIAAFMVIHEFHQIGLYFSFA